MLTIFSLQRPVPQEKTFYYTFGFSLCLPLLLMACISISFVCQGGTICTGDAPDPGSEAYRRRSKLVAQHLYALFFGLYLIWPGVRCVSGWIP